MKIKTLKHILTCLIAIGVVTLGVNRAFAETEVNDTSGAANTLVMDFDLGVTDTGKLRAGNTTPSPRDSDFFQFTNNHSFATIEITITPSGIDGAEHISYEILTTGLTPIFPGSPFTLSGSAETKTITSPNPGTAFFIRVFDDGNLTTASGDANYTVEVAGTGGIDPYDTYLEKEDEVDKLEAALKRAKKSGNKNKIRKAKKKLKAAEAELRVLEWNL